MNIDEMKRTTIIQELNNIVNDKIISQMIGKYTAKYPINSVNLKAILK